MYRHAVVKGYFYPDNAPELTNFFESSKSTTLIKDPISVIVPHAGYIYSGRTK